MQLTDYQYVPQTFIVTLPSLPFASRCHSNTVTFGKQKYSENDIFPILYINSGYSIASNSSDYKLYGYRIINNNNSYDNGFRAELIQTITLTGFGVNKWVENVIDNDNNEFIIKYSHNNYLTFGRYNIPNIYESDVTINIVDTYDNFSITHCDFVSRNQGHLYFDKKIFIPSGVPATSEKICIIIIDLLSKARERVIDLYDYGLVNPFDPNDNAFEPESMFRYNNKFMLAYSNRIYEVNFQIVKE